MRTCIDEHGLVICAEEISTSSSNFACVECKEKVVFVRDSNIRKAHFRHAVHSVKHCTLRTTPAAVEQEVVSAESRDQDSPKTEWHARWQALAEYPAEIEVCGIGGDPRPRDIADRESGCVVELQHSAIIPEQYDARNETVPNHVVWIFDATESKCWRYLGSEYEGHELFLVQDTFRYEYRSTESCTVLFQCADGQLRQAACDSVVCVELADGEPQYVRLLKDAVSSQTAYFVLQCVFGAGRWPLVFTSKEHVIQLDTPLRVTSVEGRGVVDAVHRAMFTRFPKAPITMFNGPPGAGKTKAIMESVSRWCSAGKRVLIVAYNKAVAETLNERMRQRGIRRTEAEAKTLDALCFGAAEASTRTRGGFDAEFSDKTFLNRYFPATQNSIGHFMAKLRSSGGKCSASIIDARLRNPGSRCSICKKHRKLLPAGWECKLDEFPISDIVERVATFSARRYVCDRDNLLKYAFSAYSVVVVDEMQDLQTAQELRLLRQAPCPLVMIGDMDQKIYSFKDEHDKRGCDQTHPCSFASEPIETLPGDTYEWYGSWRLDRLTVGYLEDLCGKRMLSFRGLESTVKWSPTLQNDATLVICRKNESVIETAQLHSHMKVVAGNSIASKMRQARKDNTLTLPLAEYSRSLQQAEFDKIVAMLESRSVTISVLDSDGTMAAVGTVHQLKGFEYAHCAVHSDILTSERECIFVAMSRHTKSLTILSIFNPVGVVENYRESENNF